MPRKFFIFILMVVLGLFLAFAGCKKQDVTEGKPGEEAQPAIQGFAVQIFDTVKVELTVTSPNYLYLNGPKPVIIRVPGGTKFEFDKSEYILTKPLFPMTFEFKVPKDVPLGIHTIPLAIQLMFCNKADDICQIKNDILPLVLDIIKPARATGATTVTMPATYHLEK